jgi:hypothetical protein
LTARALAAATAITAGLAFAGVAPAKPVPDPDRVLVRGLEFDLTLSKAKLRPGRVIIQFLNDGEDPHDLRLRRTDIAWAPEFGVGELEAGEYASLDTRLHRRSTYTLWCSLADHRGRGMEATLRTKRRKHR